jgi:hypothetical protein
LHRQHIFGTAYFILGKFILFIDSSALNTDSCFILAAIASPMIILFKFFYFLIYRRDNFSQIRSKFKVDLLRKFNIILSEQTFPKMVLYKRFLVQFSGRVLSSWLFMKSFIRKEFSLLNTLGKTAPTNSIFGDWDIVEP